MKKEIFDWYASKHLEAFKQVEQGAKFGLSEDQVLSAMEHCYNKIVNEGKKVPDNQIAWYVRNVAKDLNENDILNEHYLIENAKGMIADAEQRSEGVKNQLKETLGKLEEKTSEISELKRKYLDEINDLSVSLSENKEQAEKIRELNKNQIDEIKQDYKTTIDELRTRNESEIVSLKNRHKNEISQHQANLLLKTTELEKGFSQKLANEVEKRKVLIAEIKNKHSIELNKLRASHKENISKLKNEIDKTLKAKNEEISSIHKSNLERLEILNASKESMRKSLEKKLSDAKAGIEVSSRDNESLSVLYGLNKKRYRRLATFSYILVILSLIQTGLWLL